MHDGPSPLFIRQVILELKPTKMQTSGPQLLLLWKTGGETRNFDNLKGAQIQAGRYSYHGFTDGKTKAS